MKAYLKALLLVSLVLVVSCGKKKTVAGENDGGVVEKAGEVLVVADLGFAERVPADSDFFFAAYYEGEELVGGAMDWMSEYGSLTKEDLATDDGGKTLRNSSRKRPDISAARYSCSAGRGSVIS